MHFYKQKGEVHLSMDGDLVLTRNPRWPTCGTKSTMPVTVHSGRLLRWRGLRGEVRASFTALAFIWGGSTK